LADAVACGLCSAVKATNGWRFKCVWTETTLASYPKGSGGPAGALVRDSVGNLYGLTSDGEGGESLVVDAAGNLSGVGGYLTAAFKVSPPIAGQTSWTISTIASLSATSFLVPFELSPPVASQTAWTLSEINAVAGVAPSLVIDAAGNLYGETFGATAPGGSGNGTVFELLRSSGQASWTENVLYTFPGGANANPYAGLGFNGSGNIYGAIGGEGVGAVLKMYQ
jgi:hypothetical protein